METISEPGRRTPVVGKVDVVVAGGGPAGVGAALASARNGATTLLIERYGFLGGLATAGLVVVLPPPPLGGSRGYGGILEEIVNRLYSLGAAYQYQEGEPGAGEVIFNPELFKYLTNQMMEEDGVKLLYDSYVVGAIVEADVIKGVIVENKSGRQAILARVVVDATGDGDVSALAGAPFEKGAKEDLLPTAMMYIIGGVDNKKVREYQKQDPGLRNAAEKAGFLYHPWRVNERRGPSFIHLDQITRGQVAVWSGSVMADGTDAWDLTKAEIEIRKQIVSEMRFLKNYVPGFEYSYIAQTPPYIGVRETRRIIGEYVLTQEDLEKCRKFEDTIHWYVHPRYPSIEHRVPYRCLVPKKIDNLLVAGRCISTRTMEIRCIQECASMGQAAGTAAALSVKNGVTPRNLDPSLLRERLIEQGAYVEKA